MDNPLMRSSTPTDCRSSDSDARTWSDSRGSRPSRAELAPTYALTARRSWPAGFPIRGSILLTAVNGHFANSDHEVDLGAVTMRQLHTHVGSNVTVTVPRPSGGVLGEERPLPLGVPAIGAPRVGVDQLADRQAVRHLGRGDLGVDRHLLLLLPAR